MNRRTKIIVSVAGIFIVTLALIGLTYAYFLTRINGNTNPKSISVTTDKLELTYNDENGTITGTNIVPGTTLPEKTFSVTNTGSDTSYIVVLENVTVTDSSNNRTTFESDDFRYTLTCTSDCNGATDNILPLTNAILVSNDIKKGATQNYTLTVTYKETGKDQSNDMGKTLSAKINISTIEKFNPYTDTNSLAYNIINKAKTNKSGTTLSAKPLTTPGSEITSSKATGIYENEEVHSTDDYDLLGTDGYVAWKIGDTTEEAKTGASISSFEEAVGKIVYDEGHGGIFYVESYDSSTKTLVIKTKEKYDYEEVLSIAPDDYGMSYYYRGNIVDNYVTFANMCWRAVRIKGDGSIKLILEDKDEVCSSSMDGNWNIGSGTFGFTEYSPGKLTDSKGQTNAYNKRFMDYLNPGTGATGSMSTAFKNFQTNKLSGVLDKLKSGNWCLDDKTNITETEAKDIKVILSDYIRYDSYLRLYSAKPAQPTLKCNGTIMDKFGDNETDMYVGTLTADETVYAGAKYDSANSNFYLRKNHYGENVVMIDITWLTLSPSVFGSDNGLYMGYDDAANDFVFALIGGQGSDNNISFSLTDRNTNGDFRPAITLAVGTHITSGDGTINNPYIIN